MSMGNHAIFYKKLQKQRNKKTRTQLRTGNTSKNARQIGELS